MYLEDFHGGQLVLINKPFGWTSFDVVNKINKLLNGYLDKGEPKTKVGHAGTLDPLATGLLLIATGKKTKELADLQGLDKKYEGTIKVGVTTPSLDKETEEVGEFPISHIDQQLIMQAKERFLGIVKQRPPMHSAIQVDGKRLYELARKGKEIEVKEREIEVFGLEFEEFVSPFLDFKIHCSKGTYIRTFAGDFAKELGSGGYLTRLVRTAIGDFELKDAWDLEDWVEERKREFFV